MESIKLADGTELVPLEATEKENLETELKTILDKYEAMYLPAIKEEKTLSKTSQTAVLFLLKKKSSGIKSTNPEVNPLIENGESNNTTEEAPEAN